MTEHATFTAGMDIGDRFSHICVLDASGELMEETRIRSTEEGLRRYFEVRPGMRVVLEAGTHSPWMSRLLEELDQEVLVANPRRLSLISQNQNKSDETDAELLARLARVDPELLAPVKHRNVAHQRAQSVLRARDLLVRERSSAIAFVRATVKTHGSRLPTCSADSFHKLSAGIPAELEEALSGVMELIAFMTAKIKAYDHSIETVSTQFKEVALLRSVPGVGPVTALAYVATVQDPARFADSRDVGPYLGIKPRRNQSGDSDPQLRITKAGDGYTRRLLVTAAHYILGPFGPDSALRQWGLSLAERGGKAGKKRAVVAVARKLSVILLRMWKTGRAYQAFPDGHPGQKAA